MKFLQVPRHSVIGCLISSLLLIVLESTQPQAASAQLSAVTLAIGFTPDPTVLSGEGGGDRPAADVVNTRRTTTGPCLGYISSAPHEEVTLESEFSHLEMWVESELDTTLIIEGPGGVWCNDDSQGSQNPAISGEWLPGLYRVWIGAYRADEIPAYQLHISDQP